MHFIIPLCLCFALLCSPVEKYGLCGTSPSSADTIITTKGLAVSLRVLKNDSIYITVKNISKKSIPAYSHVICQEKHYDYFEVEGLTPDHEELYFSLTDDRAKSAPVILILKPGESFSHTISLVSWSERGFNKAVLKKAGFNSLPRGIQIRVKYHNSSCDNCNAYYKSIWTGYVHSDWVKF